MDLSVLAADLRAISTEVPATLTIGGHTYVDVSYNPGDLALPLQPGGILEDMGGPTVVIGRDRFGTRPLPEERDIGTVRWQGKDYTLKVASVLPGAVALTITFGTPER